jgi:PAS domain S-box-containing protein
VSASRGLFLGENGSANVTGGKDKEKAKLRKRAEDLLKKAGKSRPLRIRNQRAAEVIHELDVHRVELEMQNEELRSSRVDVEESQRKYAELYEFAPIGFCSLDRKGQIHQVNLAGAQILRIEKRYLLARPFRSFVSSGFRDDFDHFFHKIFQPGRREACESQLTRHDGVLIDVELVGGAVADPSLGVVRESQIAIVDISQRKKAESWSRRLVETTQDAVLSIDREGRIVLFNAAAERTFGYRRSEIAGQKVNVLMPEPYVSQHDEYIARYERTGEAHAIGQIRTVTAKRKNGEMFPIELSVTEIPTDEDVHYAAFIRDISEKTRLQEQLVESERLAAIGATAAKIAHEIANPLNNIYMTTQLLERQLVKEEIPVAQVGSDLRTIMSETARLNALLQQFRMISRKETYDFHPLSIAALIKEVAETCRAVWEYQKIDFEEALEPNLPSLSVDRNKLKQVLLNLFKNCAEAMPGGGKITVKASTRETGVLLEITDIGTGILPNIDIFEPFATTKAGGTGIGMVVVRQVVTAHGGSITYDSEPGKGTSFFIALPIIKR